MNRLREKFRNKRRSQNYLPGASTVQLNLAQLRLRITSETEKLAARNQESAIAIARERGLHGNGPIPDKGSFPLRLSATSHTRLRARDHYTSSTLIGGKGGTGPSSLYNTLEGPTGVSECKMHVKSTRIPSCYQIDHVSWSLGLFSKTTF